MKKNKLRHVRCNLCGKDSFNVYIKTKPLPDQTEERKFATTSNYVGNEQIVKCKNCGLIYVNPQIKQEEIIKGYAKADESTYIKESKARARTFAGCLKEVEKYKKPPAKLLDVGCAAGLFLNLAKMNGWEVYGVEPNKWLAEWGNKNFALKIKVCSFEKAAFPSNYFDVVTFWDVLEHLSNPKQNLKAAAKILKRGGYLVVNYPDIGSPLARLFGKKWWFILSIHLYYFTPKTITMMLEKTGFKVIKIKPHIQRLSLGYLIQRLKPYSPLLYKLMKNLVEITKLKNLEVPYYAAQTMVIAQKK